jgi:hypothetical protein
VGEGAADVVVAFKQRLLRVMLCLKYGVTPDSNVGGLAEYKSIVLNLYGETCARFGMV